MKKDKGKGSSGRGKGKIKVPPGGHGKTRIGSVWLDLSDGGGLIFSPTKDGGIVVTHVPPREPVTGGITVIPSLVVDAGSISAPRISERLKSMDNIGQEVMAAIAMLGE